MIQQLLSHAGKVGKRGSGKYTNAWNVEHSNGNKLSIDLDEVAVWEEATDTDEVNAEFLLHETHVSQISDEVHHAKLKLCKLKSWKS